MAKAAINNSASAQQQSNDEVEQASLFEAGAPDENDRNADSEVTESADGNGRGSPEDDVEAQSQNHDETRTGALDAGAQETLQGPKTLTSFVLAEGTVDVYHAPPVPGEYSLALSALNDWHAYSRKQHNFGKGVARSLLDAAQNPDAIEPLRVMAIDNRIVVLDGALRLAALRLQHADNAEIMIRVVLTTGTEQDEVLAHLRQKCLSLTMTDFDKAGLIKAGFAVLDIQKQAFASLLGISNAKLTRYLASAYAEDLHPCFFRLLKTPGSASLDFGYKIGRAIIAAEKKDRDAPPRRATDGAVAKLGQRCARLLEKDERFDPAEALARLSLADEKKLRAKEVATDEKPRKVRTLTAEPISLGDVEVGAFEVFEDHKQRVRLPDDLAGLSQQEFDEVSEAWLSAVRWWWEQRRPQA